MNVGAKMIKLLLKDGVEIYQSSTAQLGNGVIPMYWRSGGTAYFPILFFR